MVEHQTPHIKDSEQAVLNKSFDPSYEVLATEQLVYNSTGSGTLERLASPLVNVAYDSITITYPSDTTEEYCFRQGGAGGTIKSTLTLTYTDSTKANLSSVVRT